jgi:hypothetical protein
MWTGIGCCLPYCVRAIGDQIESPALRHLDTGERNRLGHESNRHLDHLARPDFDHVINVSGETGASTSMRTSPPRGMTRYGWRNQQAAMPHNARPELRI